MKNIFKVIKQTEPIQVSSQKAEGGMINKSTIVLQELGGRYENTYVVALLGSSAMCKFYAGDLVVAALHFSTHEHNATTYQDIVANEIIKLS
ncbi:MAG: hypothetical protein J6R91_06170 [Bacteroidaceae bacterium]|nr:hypothetical protein [Bacteroidaceae bacterium]